ncbi:MAG: LON peptidase substrate-binding domain-containing protein [Micavibrio sp.]|nr:LON peptidase substrate-binding domain-containing protein [Micavibrio sp.]
MKDINPFAPLFKDLPETLPVFPLTSVLLMPFGQLPLNIFEPRYLRMIEDAMRTDRMIGMIQPRNKIQNKNDLYEIGCAGKITEFTETDDGRYLISLTGICRFKILSEQSATTPYRIVHADWALFEDDLQRRGCLEIDRERLMKLLSTYFEQEDMECDFSMFDGVPDGKLMTCLSMVCPFDAGEKQMLLEQICCVERSRLFMSMLEMAVQSGARADKNCH